MSRTKLAASALAMGVFLNACASGSGTDAAPEEAHRQVAPPSAALRQRMDRIVLHVDSEAGLHPNPQAEETPGPGDDQASAAGKGAAGGAVVGAAFGLALIGVGCNGDWKEYVVITCPITLVAGIGTTVVGALIGGLGGAVVDVATSGPDAAPAGTTVDAVAGRSVASFLAPEPVPAFRTRLADAIKAKTSTRLAVLTPDGPALEHEAANARRPLVLLVRINDLRFVRTNGDAPELWLRIRLSAALYDDPDSERLDLRGWRYTTRLGELATLTGMDAAGLEPKINDAMAKMVTAVVEDLFLAEGAEREVVDFYVAEKIVPNGGSDPRASYAPFWNPGSKAECGDISAQRALGRRYAALDPRIYGPMAREKWVEAYKWLRLAENGGADDAAIHDGLDALRQKLLSGKIEAAEQEIAGWTPKQCDEEVEKEKEAPGVEKGEPADKHAAAGLTLAATLRRERPGRS